MLRLLRTRVQTTRFQLSLHVSVCLFCLPLMSQMWHVTLKLSVCILFPWPTLPQIWSFLWTDKTHCSSGSSKRVRLLPSPGNQTEVSAGSEEPGAQPERRRGASFLMVRLSPVGSSSCSLSNASEAWLFACLFVFEINLVLIFHFLSKFGDYNLRFRIKLNKTHYFPVAHSRK